MRLLDQDDEEAGLLSDTRIAARRHELATRRYRMTKFVRRNKTLVGGFAAMRG